MLTLDAIRECLEGAVPSAVATCSWDGVPNVSFVSQVHYVDPGHVALSFQFFTKTRENVLTNRQASALLIHPSTAAQYSLRLEYLRTETSGPLFETMKARLSGIASHTGMSGVFQLRGSDVYRVLNIAALPGPAVSQQPVRRNVLSALRACSETLARAGDLAALLDAALASLETQFGVHHSMVLMFDQVGKRLYTVASRGYPQSGVGSEIALGVGVIGVAAEQRTPIRITYMTAEYSYSRAIRDSMEREGLTGTLETAIPFPGLADPGSQLAAPIVAGAELIGVLYVESADERRFAYDDEDAVATLAAQLGAAIQSLRESGDHEDANPVPAPTAQSVAGAALAIRHYSADDSVFIDDTYLIKGVAGAVFCKLLRDYAREGRTDFTNRELRLDSGLGLPDVTDNLEARLILLERRLSEHRAPLRIQKTGRGRFRLIVQRPFTLSAVK